MSSNKIDNIIITSNDLMIFKLLSKYRVMSYIQLGNIINRNPKKISKRVIKLCKHNYLRRVPFINNEIIVIAKKKALNEINDKSKPYSYNPNNRSNSYHELKVNDTMIFLSKKYHIEPLSFLTHRDMYNRFSYDIPDLEFYHNDLLIAVEVEVTPKSISKTREKITQKYAKKYDKVYFLIDRKHVKIILALKSRFLAVDVVVLDINSFEEL